MTDIAEQLRNYGLSHLKGTPSVIAEAADEIERLRARAETAEQRVVELVESRNGILDQRDAFHKRVKELEASRSEIIILRNTFRKRVKELEARLASEESASSQTRAERYNLAQQVKELTKRLEALQQEVRK